MGFKTTAVTDGTTTIARTTHDEQTDLLYATAEVHRPTNEFERNMAVARLSGPWNANLELRVLDSEGRALAKALTEHYARLDGDVG